MKNMSEIQLTDQLGHVISLPDVPTKIVSLVPSITYLLYILSLENEIAGITRFCKLPPHLKKQKLIVGGTKNVKFDKIATLQPDIILTNKEENTKEIVYKLRKIAPVYVSDISNLNDNDKFISDLGIIFNRHKKAQRLIDDIKVAKSSRYYANKPYKRAAYLIWKKPWMTVGADTFINYMMQLAGFENVFANYKRYPQIDLKDLQKLKPEVILLSSEPYPFKEKEQSFLQEFFPDTCIMLVQGEPFTWFGAYPVHAFPYFNRLQKEIDVCIQKKKN